MGRMQNVNVPSIGALKSGWKPYSSRMTRYSKVSFGRDDMLYARNARLHQNNADICPVGGGTYDDENNPVELDENKLQEFTEKYGCTDWYEWQLANWGTKWGDSDTTIREDSTKDDKRRVVITYRSPWSEPYKLLEHISYKYNLRLINRVRYEAEMYGMFINMSIINN